MRHRATASDATLEARSARRPRPFSGFLRYFAFSGDFSAQKPRRPRWRAISAGMFSVHPARVASGASYCGRYGLMSIRGVPSRISTSSKRSRVPSRRMRRTMLRPIGFGRQGCRVEKIPRSLSSDLSSDVGNLLQYLDHELASTPAAEATDRGSSEIKEELFEIQTRGPRSTGHPFWLFEIFT